MRARARRLSLLLVLAWLVLGLAGHGHAITYAAAPAHEHTSGVHDHAETADAGHHRTGLDSAPCPDCPARSDSQCCCGFGHCLMALPLPIAGHWLSTSAPRPKPIAEALLTAALPTQPVRPPIA